MKKITLICGSLRQASYNKKLLRLAETWLKDKTAEEIISVDLVNHNVPLYSGDTESNYGIPKEIIDLSEIIKDSSLIIFVSPEYNGGIAGSLKNIIDWTSRVAPNPWTGKHYLLMGATIGGFGTVKSMIQVTQIIHQMKGIVLPDSFGLSFAQTSFTAEENFVQDKDYKRMDQVLQNSLNYLGIPALRPENPLTERP